MIVVCESAVSYGISKPVICSKCERGRLGSIPADSETVVSRRGNPPPKERGDYLQVKCPVCGALWSLMIEN